MSTTTSSTKPYMLRAIYDWCADNNFTPYIAVFVDQHVRVPADFVQGNEIVLNISAEATSGLELGQEWIVFSARFGGVARKLEIPMQNILAIYAQENGQGMAFPVERNALNEDSKTREVPSLSLVTPQSTPAETAEGPPSDPPDSGPKPPSGRPSLRVVK